MAMIWLFDNQKKLKKPIRRVVEIIHDEGEYTAEAQIMSDEKPEYGEYFGLKCVDGCFRLFLIRAMDISDETGICTLTGTDAAVAELNTMIVESLGLDGKTAQEAVQQALNGTSWMVGRVEKNNEFEAPDAYYESVWEVLKTIGTAAKVRAVPYFEFTAGQITGRKVDLISKTPVWRGLIHTRKKGAKNIIITEEGVPYGRVYGLGKVTGSGDPPERLTFADVVWSRENGDPADKPAGQTWVAFPGAKTDAAYMYEDNRQTDGKKLISDAFADLESKQRPKASGSANIGDMEFAPGYEHRIVRIWDKAVVRTAEGYTVETTVLNIKRYYVRREMTKIILGEENETDIYRIENQIAKLNTATISASRRAGSAGAAAQENKRAIIAAEEQILLRAFRTEVVQLEQETAVEFTELYVDLDTIKQQIELKANVTTVDNLKNVVDELDSTVTIQAGQISSKVSHNDVISSINQTPESVVIDAGRIDLSGYVTASQLQATQAQITNLMSGLTAATVLETNLLNANQADVTYLSADALNIADISTQFRTVSMGNVMSHRFVVESTTGEISLQHSHAVSVNETTGMVQLGEVSETGGNFNIADTKFFKDAVAAAGGEFNLSSAGWINGTNIVTAKNNKFEKNITVELPEFSASGGTTWDSTYKTTVYFSTPSVNVPLKSVVVDAMSVYQAGGASVELFDMGWDGKTNKVITLFGKEVTINLPKLSLTQGQWNEDNYKSIYLRMRDTSGDEIELGETLVFADEIFEKGAATVTLSENGWQNGEYVVSASNGESVTVELPEFSATGGSSFNSEHKTTVNFSTPSVNVPLKSVTVDASGVYETGHMVGYGEGVTDYKPTSISRTSYSTENKTVTVKASNSERDLLSGIVIDASEIYTAGWNDAFDAVTVGYSSFTITNTAANTFFAQASIWAKVDGTTAASTKINKTQKINVGQ